jgi:hypothetical protein
MSVKPPELAFLNGLSHEQIVYAVKVAQAAERAGVPPKLAVAIAYQESGLNPNVPNGTAGEIGLMQIKPNTAKGEGFSLADIKTPQGNIDAGVAYLKKSWELNKKNPKLTAYGYNRGIDDPMFYGGEANPLGQDYVTAIEKHGAFNGLVNETPANTEAPASTASEAPAEDTEAKSERSTVVAASPPSPKPPDTSGASKGERFVTGSVGTAIGASVPLGKGIFKAKDARDIRKAGEIAKAEEEARLSVQAVNESAKAGKTVPPSVTPPSSLTKLEPIKPIPVGPKDAGRMAKGQTGAGVYNYAKDAGLTDIEAARALDMTKNEGGAHDLSTQRREGLNRVNQIAPNQFVENPQYGGLMTPDQGGGKGPKASFKVQGPLSAADAPVDPYMRGPAAPPPQGTLVEIPKPTPPAPPSLAQRTAAGLDEVANLFKSMMKPVADTAKYAGKYALPPLAGLSAGLDVAEMAHEYDKPPDQRDYIKMATKGAGVVGGALSMFPPTAPFGVPLMLGASAVDLYRDPAARAYAEKKMQEMQQGVQRRFDQVPSDYSDPMGYAQ